MNASYSTKFLASEKPAPSAVPPSTKAQSSRAPPTKLPSSTKAPSTKATSSTKGPITTKISSKFQPANVMTESEAFSSPSGSVLPAAEGSRLSTELCSDCDYCEGQPRGGVNDLPLAKSDVWGLNDGASKPTTPTGWTDVDARHYGDWASYVPNQVNNLAWERAKDLENNSSHEPMCWHCGRRSQDCVCDAWDIAATPRPTQPNQKKHTWSDVCGGAGVQQHRCTEQVSCTNPQCLSKKKR